MDISDFFDSFFEEAEELLDDMEDLLLNLDSDSPDSEQLNAIFRAAHSIKGGAGAFGFTVLQETTHVLENLLDMARHGQLAMSRDIVDVLLQSKDILQDQLGAYRRKEEPDARTFAEICETLKNLASTAGAPASVQAAAAPAAPAQPAESLAGLEPVERIARVLQQLAVEAGATIPEPAAQAAADPAAEESAPVQRLEVVLSGVGEKDRALLLDELKHLGEVASSGGDDKRFEVKLDTTVDAESIEAVLCFVIEPDQLSIRQIEGPAPAAAPAAPTAPAASAASAAPAAKAAAGNEGAKAGAKAAKTTTESSSIRVPVDKVDQIINLVGELIITQSMLDQTASGLEEEAQRALRAGLQPLQRNARDLQEAVMSIRMLPMDHVFSRFPRQVRDLAAKLGKEVELVMEGKSTELDKGLIERITDPLTHLVRNSLDHGIEKPDVREAAGKPRCGRLVLSAHHQGGNIIILVSDDGGGLNRAKLLEKARSNGMNVGDDMSDDEVWQLIFAPGFSTAEQVSDVSGRGVGMDVVKRNIQSMGGHVELLSTPGKGTTTRVVLPLTLAILDGMTVRVGEEMFVLPLTGVIELVQPSEDTLFTMAGEDVLLKVRDEYLPVVELREVMQVPGEAPEMCESIAVIVQGEERSYALLVDEPVGQQQVVVKNLESNYRKVPGVAGATILGDGAVALILDVGGLQRANHSHKQNGARTVNKPQFQTEVEQP